MAIDSNLIPYLLGRGLIDPSAIVDGHLGIIDLSRRNRNSKVVWQGGRGYFVKRGPGNGTTTSMAREAAVLRILCDAGGDLARFVPRLVDYDVENGLLICELASGYPDLREYHWRRGRFPTSIGRLLGLALASLHGLKWSDTAGQDSLKSLSRPPSWVLSIHRPSLAQYHDLSWGNRELIRTVQSSPAIVEGLDRLREEWRTDTLIHFDAKWDNWVIGPRAKNPRQRQIKLVDWEFAGFGDPAWDIAAVFASYLEFWISSMPSVGDLPAEQLLASARYRLDSMWPALRAFWYTYVSESKLTSTTAAVLLLRSCSYMAARLLEVAYSQGYFSQQVSGHAGILLQLSSNLLEYPYDAPGRLLGIPLAGHIES